VINWSERVANPDALGQAEKQLWQGLEPKIKELFNELKRNGKVETVYSPSECVHLSGVLEKLDATSRIHNTMLHISDSQQKIKSFLEGNKQFGIDEPISTGIYINAALLVDIFSTELFKLPVLFHLKGLSHEVSRFSVTMKDNAPSAWQDLAPYVDNPFRNAIAHGTFAIRNKRVIVYKDAKLVPIEEMELHEFMMRLKRQNVLFHCLINVIAELQIAGWFT